jgi:hypothetical protein
MYSVDRMWKKADKKAVASAEQFKVLFSSAGPRGRAKSRPTYRDDIGSAVTQEFGSFCTIYKPTYNWFVTDKAL